MPVLDASVLVEYLAGGEHAQEARRRILEDPGRLWAPHLIDAEIGHVLRRGTLAGELSEKAARSALDAQTDLPLRRPASQGVEPAGERQLLRRPLHRSR